MREPKAKRRDEIALYLLHWAGIGVLRTIPSIDAGGIRHLRSCVITALEQFDILDGHPEIAHVLWAEAYRCVRSTNKLPDEPEKICRFTADALRDRAHPEDSYTPWQDRVSGVLTTHISHGADLGNRVANALTFLSSADRLRNGTYDYIGAWAAAGALL